MLLIVAGFVLVTPRCFLISCFLMAFALPGEKNFGEHGGYGWG